MTMEIHICTCNIHEDYMYHIKKKYKVALNTQTNQPKNIKKGIQILIITDKDLTESKLDEKSKFYIPSKYAKFQNFVPFQKLNSKVFSMVNQ